MTAASQSGDRQDHDPLHTTPAHMHRYDTRIDDETLFIETAERDLEIGSMSVVRDLLGET